MATPRKGDKTTFLRGATDRCRVVHHGVERGNTPGLPPKTLAENIAKRNNLLYGDIIVIETKYGGITTWRVVINDKGESNVVRHDGIIRADLIENPQTFYEGIDIEFQVTLNRELHADIIRVAAGDRQVAKQFVVEYVTGTDSHFDIVHAYGQRVRLNADTPKYFD